MKRSIAVLVCVVSSTAVHAHESRPIYIELTETAARHYQLHWKTPPSISASGVPDVRLPQECQAQAAVAQIENPEGIVRRASYYCPQGLSGQSLNITYPGLNPSLSSLVRMRTATGEKHLAVLGPEERTWKIPQAESAARVARQYAWLGMRHIAAGVDHLLFLACLLWIAGTWRRILMTITGFTAAHSITLALSALQWIRLPVPPVEAGIALSILFLAAEIAKGPCTSLTWRYPIAVASSFGLLHGFGFAAALTEIGLPQTELFTGLLFFNVGVELGQVMFAAAAITAIRILQRMAIGSLAPRLAVVQRATSYAAGTLSAYWLIERCAAFT